MLRMVHQRQGLPLGLEAGEDLGGVHARLDDLEGDHAADRLFLLGHEDDAHAAFADLLQQLVGADDGAGAFGDTLVGTGLIGLASCGGRAHSRLRGRAFKEEVHLAPQLVVGTTSLVQVGVPFLRPMALDRSQEDLLHSGEFNAHDKSLLWAFLTY